MIKENQRVFNRIHVLLDAGVVTASYCLAWFLKFNVPFLVDDEAGILSQSTYMSALFFLIPGYIFLYSFFGMYAPKRATRRKYELISILQANTVGIILFFVVLFVMRQMDFSRQMLFIFYFLNIFFTVSMRSFIRSTLQFMRRRQFNLKYVLVVGYSRAAEEYITRINQNQQWGYMVRAILDDRVPRGLMYKGVKVVGRIDNLEFILPTSLIDEIAITLPLADYGQLGRITELCEKSGIHTKFIPDYNVLVPGRPYTEDLMGLPVINIRYVPLSNTLMWMIKRGMDIIGAVVGIILFSPLMLFAMIAIRLTSRGPIIFKQERVGLNNRPFNIYKFRTMEMQKDIPTRFWTIKDDPRVTKIGRFLRKTSIDEMPQFFNILIGEMSLVGPRPEQSMFVEEFKEEIPRYMIKHQVRPGLTGWAQVNGYRGDTSIRKRIEYDMYYIENWTLSFDVQIILMTVFKGFFSKNA
ncbi:MAG: undecaprenyl-phosphate glucose phosphotransferase [Lachnospiraceae bacterium]|jgi:Undecaprenyl-phosphate glucose phosphotransferase|nr:undecaprenyl-phosphate glucose phosphotransferase [Lachnospiraceae bacterium]